MTDRMAAFRAQRQAQAGGAPMENGAGTGQAHELASLDASSLDSMPGFLAEAASIQDAITAFSADVTRIGALNNRVLDVIGDVAGAKAELDTLVGATMARSNELKERIKRLQGAVLQGGGRTRQEREMRQNRATFVRTKFTEALQTYRQVEQEYQTKAKQRVERQYRIVKPNATQDEIRDALADGGGNQVFMQALTSNSDYANARSAYTEAQSRAQDLRKMEETLGELAQLFNDMAVLVDQQNETFVAIEENAAVAEDNVRQGEEQVSIAVKIAKSLRRKRWICFFIVLIVVIILAVVLAIEFTKKN